MKAYKLTIAFALVSLQLSAQELMKVELKEGKTVEYKVEDVKRVYFDASSTTDESEIKTTSAIMWVGDKKNIEGDVKTASSLDDFVASVKDGVITANHTGATVIVVNEKHPIVVMVFSINNSISDPVLKWGAPKDTIKAKQKQGTLYEEDVKSLLYKNCGDATGIGYSFDDNGGLSLVGVFVPSSKGYSFTKYLKDRFFIYPEKQADGYYFGFDAYDPEKANTIIYYTPSGSTYQCIYVPASRLFENNARKKAIEKPVMDEKTINKLKEIYKLEVKNKSIE